MSQENVQRAISIEAGLNDLELTAMIGHNGPRMTNAIYDTCSPTRARRSPRSSTPTWMQAGAP